jgi:hypothetical protein
MQVAMTIAFAMTLAAAQAPADVVSCSTRAGTRTS